MFLHAFFSTIFSFFFSKRKKFASLLEFSFFQWRACRSVLNQKSILLKKICIFRNCYGKYLWKIFMFAPLFINGIHHVRSAKKKKNEERFIIKKKRWVRFFFYIHIFIQTWKEKISHISSSSSSFFFVTYLCFHALVYTQRQSKRIPILSKKNRNSYKCEYILYHTYLLCWI